MTPSELARQRGGPRNQNIHQKTFDQTNFWTKNCDAKRVGEAARGSLKRRYPPKIFPKFFQNAPEVLPRTSQEPPKPFPNQARSTHETKEAPKKRPRAPKKRQHGAQERPNGAQEPPQTLQNGGIECPRPNFLMFFSMLFFRW